MRSEALPRRARLSEGGAFRTLLRSRRIERSGRFLVQASANGERFSRLGIIVGKRVVRRAVDRSLLKRLVRETFRRLQHRLAGFDLLVRARCSVSADEAMAASEELRALLGSAVE